MPVRLIVLGLLITGLIGCAQSLITFESRPYCKTTVEGRYFSDTTWTGETPALILPNERDLTSNTIIKYGAILQLTADSIRFDEREKGTFNDPAPTAYPLQHVITVIDSTGAVIFGELPKRYAKKYLTTWAMELRFYQEDDPNQQIRRMKFGRDTTFAYCIDPGTYHVEQILFYDHVGNSDRLAESIDWVFTIHRNRVNYIGDFYLDLPQGDGRLYELPYVIHNRPQSAAAAGVLGGAIGGALLAASQSAKGVIGHHSLRITQNEGFTPTASRPVEISIVHPTNTMWGE